MVSFNNLPPEILGIILHHSSLAIVLWQCGDHSLNARLSSGITNMLLSHFPLKEFVVPKMVSELRRLKQLEIHALNDVLKDKKRWSLALRALPRGLESLTIDSTDSDQVFLNFDTALQFADYYQPSAEQRYIRIEPILPNLQTLVLKRSARGMEKSIFASLPPSLTSLTIENGWFYLPFSSSLPRGLQYLDLNVIMGTGSLKESFDDLLKLPPTLSLNRIQIYQTDDQTSLTRLPPGLRFLQLMYIEQCPPSLVAQLPRSLTKLDLSNVIDLDWSEFVNFSRGVKANNAINPSFWPPCLESLIIRLKTCEAGALLALPRNIKHLALTIAKHSEVFFADELPQEIEVLELSTFYPRVEGFFPASITSLRSHNFSESYAAALPISLTELSVLAVGHTLVTQPLDFALSTGIRTLSLGSWQVEWFEAIPATVTSLTIVRLNLEILRSTVDLPPVNLWRNLPHNLVRLEISAVSSAKRNLALFPAASLSSLMHLNLPPLLYMDYKSIERLPRSLKTLEASLVGIERNSSSLALLPPHLESSHLDDATYRIEDLGDVWPPTAWRSLVSTAGRHHIPRLLERLHPVENPLIPWVSSIIDLFKR